MNKTVNMNQLINTFIELKKIGLSKDKCYWIHIGKGHEQFPKLSVHGKVMKEANKKNIYEILLIAVVVLKLLLKIERRKVIE